MAGELQIRANLTFQKNDGTIVEMLLGPLDRDVAGDYGIMNIQDVGFAAEELLLLGDVGVGGYLIARNRDTTNFVSIRGVSGATALVQLKPGDFCLFRISPGATPYVIADTAAVKLAYAVIKL